ncbi:MAG: MOSC domain-containing protein [Novosphingobium sp.]
MSNQINAPAAPLLGSVQVGRVAPLGPKGVPSGFVKRPVSGPVRVSRLNLEGDVQADLSVHGGPDKAVYAYGAGQYAAWAQDFPHHADRLVPGAFGENLTIAALSEDDICVGDVHAIGTARLQVCQPRQPCFKLALMFEDDRLPFAMTRNGRSGWYYRVLEEGTLTAGDKVVLAERPNPDFPLTRLIRLLYGRKGTDEDFAMIAEAKGVADWLRNAARHKLGLG